uniref:Uncharacterized protein n=1 Tax=Candidatus Nitrotoga fabula TaxID=2182327 RepID=A0A2X0RCM6_9PROT|nr:protein of unknown function [Candidatus Nitrotoga fabula]
MRETPKFSSMPTSKYIHRANIRIETNSQDMVYTLQEKMIQVAAKISFIKMFTPYNHLYNYY